ncbi:MAG: RecX family transcriptional regulator [Candidatus Cloacimonadales bacterium]|jgi:regulatory protein|nr:RecX family transcriptional regulator [Candidatus Cloacimonadota bacterium]MDD2649910.1 RecX family transcriptional regulator [Candidatus Cloacimonadota bacterium]MDD3501890.1 RecX family transcriptional regulator [Candidatus Cloacimonadota bacterium]MDX9976719.1 RecX family transcriptional regulator [Candidatus Cloacimonadales bacterium]
MTKIYLTIPNKKNYLREIKTEEGSIGVLPMKSLPFSLHLKSTFTDQLVFEKEIEDNYLEVLRQSCISFARNKLLDYLAKSEKTKYDCIVFLRRYQIPEFMIRDLVKWAEEQKYLSDERYAEMYIQEAMLSYKSANEIRFKLKQKRVDSVIIEKLLLNIYNREAELELLEQYIEQMLNHEKEVNPKKLFERCATKLYRKGFKYDSFSRALAEKIDKKLD